MVSFFDVLLRSEHKLRLEEVLVPERFEPWALATLRLSQRDDSRAMPLWKKLAADPDTDYVATVLVTGQADQADLGPEQPIQVPHGPGDARDGGDRGGGGGEAERRHLGGQRRGQVLLARRAQAQQPGVGRRGRSHHQTGPVGQTLTPVPRHTLRM